MDHGRGTLPVSGRIERLRAARRVRIEPVTNDATIIGFATVIYGRATLLVKPMNSTAPPRRCWKTEPC